MKNHERLGILRAGRGTALLLLLAFGSAAHAGGVEVGFTKSFGPSTIGPGSVSTLTFTITNFEPMIPLADLAFTDMLPAGVTIAAPSRARSFCGGTLSAPSGGDTITFSGGMLGVSQSCTIRVDVTSATVATHMNVSGTLTSDAGGHGTASADLTVATDRPGFTKFFSPSSVSLNGRSTLTFTLDNTANAADVVSASFVDNLPSGMVVASPSNAATDCVSSTAPNTTLTANPGSSVISFNATGLNSPPSAMGSGVVDNGETCFISVDVIGGSVGMLGNTSGELSTVSGTAALVSAGKAGAVLTVTGGAAEPILLIKEFTNDPVPPGGSVNLRFRITNTSRTDTATAIAFSDDLNAALAGLTFTAVASNDCDATPTGIGMTTISFAGGSLAPEASCTFNATLAVPAAAAPGTYSNTTSTITATVGGQMVTGSAASDMLFVVAFPLFTKEFIDDPAGSGGTVTLRFTLTNTSSTLAVSDIAFTDDLNTAIPGLAANGLVSMGDPAPLMDICGMGSELTVADPAPMFLPPDATMLIFTGGNLATAGSPGDSCTFDVVLDIPTGIPGGVYVNTTSAPTATVGMSSRTGQPASDGLVIVGAPLLSKEFTDDPVPPGGTVTLEFTLEHDAGATGDASAIAFTDDLSTVISGLMAASVLSNGCGGMVDITTDPTLIDFSGGGTLMPGDTCTIQVSLDVPMSAVPGSFPNTTSAVSADVGGVATTEGTATDDLRVAGLMLTKQFIDDPTIPGDNVILRFTLDNASGVANADAISFDDDLDATLSGLTVVSPMLPATLCGGTLTFTAGTLMFSGGSVVAMDTCFFEVTLEVPMAAALGEYDNVTTPLNATIGGTPGFVLDAATDDLIVDNELLAITKEFTDDPVLPGDPVTLELTIDNLDPTRMADMVAFTDDLDAALSGLTINSVGLDDCGGTLGGVGTGLLTNPAATVAGGGSCTVRLELDVPAGPLAGDTFTNTTSAVTGEINGFAVNGPAASDDLRVVDILLEKAFGGGGVGFPGQTVTLTFTITNLDATQGAVDLAFSDALPAGLSAVAPLPTAPCGAGSTLSGTTFLTLSGASLGPSGVCSFPVTVLVPAAASPGAVVNTTSDLFSAGLSVSGPGSDTLTIEPPPTFAKSFAPAAIGIGQTSTLSFSIDNVASTVAATGLAFTDNLPAGIEVAAIAGNMCGGTLTAIGGTTTISLSGGSVGPGSSCLIQVNVTATMTGALLNTTGDLTSSSGNSGTASDTLTVNPQPGFAKAFAPNPIVAGDTSTLTFTIDNSGSSVAATALDFTDNLPAAVTIASPSMTTDGCGGTLTALAGSGTISYTGGTVGAGVSCTVDVEVTSVTTGSHDNTSGDLTSSLGNSGPASDTLIVNANPVPAFSKAFAPAVINVGGVSTLTFTIDNSGSLLDATGLDFIDPLPAAVTIASPSMTTNGCGGTLTALAGSGTISYTGGTVAAGAMCTVTVNVAGNTAGMHLNTSGDLTSSLGNSGPASDTLTVTTVAGMDLTLDKAFLTDPVLPGGTVDIEFTITNVSPSLNATDITFMDDLNGAIPGLAAVGLPVAGCGGTVTGASGDTVLTFAGGALAFGASCTFQVTVRVPASTAPGMYTNTTGPISGSFGAAKGGGGPGAPASASFNVAFLSFTKAFTGPAPAGGTATLVFTITNPDPANSATGIGFTDDLNAFIAGAQAVALPQNNVCGAGSTLTGTSVITLSGGNLGPGGSCTFQVFVSIPNSTAPGNYTNVTGVLAATVGGTAVTGAGAVTATAVLGVGGVFVVPTLTAWGLLALIGLVLMVSARRLGRIR